MRVANKTNLFLQEGDSGIPTDDRITGYSLKELSYALELLFPAAQLNETPAWSESVQEKLLETSIATGSRTENFHLPTILKLDDDFCVTEFDQSDLDVMHLWQLSATSKGTSDGSQPAIIIDPTNCHPGYVCLRLEDKAGDLPERVRKCSYWRNGSFYLSSSILMDAECEKYNFSHGPAAVSILAIAEQDHVYCLKSPDWPAIALAWPHRHRLSGWPSNDTVQEVVKQGCLIVPVAHPHAADPSCQWRLSFSVGEKLLAKTLNETQIYCYLILKILFSMELKQPKGLCSYHMKNIFFWACEQIPAGYWTGGNEAACLLYLLDQLVLCLSSRRMPHYFLPENNLIDHIDRDFIKTLATKASSIRKDPLLFLCEFKDNRKFFTGPFTNTVDKIIWPVVEGNNENSSQKQMGYLQAGLDMATLFITDATICQNFATDMLKCYGKLFKGKYALKSHAQVVLQPILCTEDILNTVSNFSSLRSSLLKGHEGTSSLARDILRRCALAHTESSVSYEEEGSRELDSTLRGAADPSLKELSIILADLLSAEENLTQRFVDLSTEDNIQSVRHVLYVAFAYLIIFLHHDMDDIWHKHLSNLEEAAKTICQNKAGRYFTCVTAILAAAYLREKSYQKGHAILSNLPEACSLKRFFKCLLQKQLQGCSKHSGTSSSRYVDMYFDNPNHIAYGSVFEKKIEDGRSMFYQWEIMYFIKFKTLPDSNAFKKAFGNLAEKFFKMGIVHSENNISRQISLQADYANFLVDSGRYKEALEVLMSVVTDIHDSGYDVRNEYIGYLKLVIYKDIFRGMGRSIHRKITFYSLPYAYFFAVKSLVQLGDSQGAINMAYKMESVCDDIYQRNKQKDPWQDSANNYSLLGHAYRICGQTSRAVLAFSLVTWLREDNIQPEKAKEFTGMKDFKCPSDATPKAVAETYVKLLWPGASLTVIWSALLQTLYPHLRVCRSAIHFFHLIYHRQARCSDVKLLLQVTSSSLSSSREDQAQFALAFSTSIETIFPDDTLSSGLKKFLLELHPNLYPYKALQNYLQSVISKDVKFESAMTAVVGKFFGDDGSSGNVVLNRYITEFFKDLPVERAVEEFFFNMYPGQTLEQSVREYFEDNERTVEQLLHSMKQVIEEVRGMTSS